MAITLENEYFTAKIEEKGAELISLFSKKEKTEYIWHGDSQFWGRHTPVLFPIVGRLKDDQYAYKGKAYFLNQHGFARDSLFSVIEQSSTMVSLQLTETEETLKKYPFVFQLILTFTLSEKGISTQWKVKNSSKEEELYFGIGGHPAFNVPLEEGLHFEDYFLEISPNGEYEKIPFIPPYLDVKNKYREHVQKIALTHELFAQDAIVYETPTKSVSITLGSETGKRSLTLSYQGIPYVGLWSPYPKKSPFVCIEPWCSIADTTESTGDFSEKIGIQKLAPQTIFEASYFIEPK